MNGELDDGEAPKRKPEPVGGPLSSERDKLKIERRNKKDEHHREVRPEYCGIEALEPLGIYFKVKEIQNGRWK